MLNTRRWGEPAPSADQADFGVLHGPFAAWRLLRTPVLHRYCTYLASVGVGADEEVRPSGAAGGGLGAPESEAKEEDTSERYGRAGRAEGEEGESASQRVAGGSWVADTGLGGIAEGEGAQTGWEEQAGREDLLADAMSAEAGALAELCALVAGGGGAHAEAALLDRAMAVGARHGCMPLVEAALGMGADTAPVRRSSQPYLPHHPGSLSAMAGLPALHAAACEGHAAVVERLLLAGAPPTWLSPGGDPPLHLACGAPRGFPAIAPLLEAGAPLAMRDARRQTPLHTAARAGNTRAVHALLQAVAQSGAFPSGSRVPYHELLDRWHRSGLHWAVVNGWLETAGALIDAGAAVNGVRSAVTGKPMPLGKHLKGTSLPQECPLHSAARLPPAKAEPMIRLLLAAQADPTVKDQFGRTAVELLEPSVAIELGLSQRSEMADGAAPCEV